MNVAFNLLWALKYPFSRKFYIRDMCQRDHFRQKVTVFPSDFLLKRTLCSCLIRRCSFPRREAWHAGCQTFRNDSPHCTLELLCLCAVRCSSIFIEDTFLSFARDFHQRLSCVCSKGCQELPAPLKSCTALWRALSFVKVILLDNFLKRLKKKTHTHSQTSPPGLYRLVKTLGVVVLGCSFLLASVRSSRAAGDTGCVEATQGWNKRIFKQASLSKVRYREALERGLVTL